MAQVWKLRGPPDASMPLRVQLRAEGKDWFMQKESLFIILPSSSSSAATQTLSPLGLLLLRFINIPDELQMNVDSQKYDSNQRLYCFRDERERFKSHISHNKRIHDDCRERDSPTALLCFQFTACSLGNGERDFSFFPFRRLN